MNLSASIAIARIIASLALPKPDLIRAWDTPATAADFYEVQVAANIELFAQPTNPVFTTTLAARIFAPIHK